MTTDQIVTAACAMHALHSAGTDLSDGDLLQAMLWAAALEMASREGDPFSIAEKLDRFAMGECR